ncbi:DEAD/DEAH box helicase [Nitrococcus mobilis]|uniref:Lhr-like helicase n=1 Tax=Nitrococcus mobilis Nb-231 TaxID=314278 RepID=A4BLZ4_9GAMM|nr:DEAD/DEAH box helicase [Nitrococcus mobilis]EAR23332.1 Lhr-like helicase [Nitrococcus mobilis Nb-231]
MKGGGAERVSAFERLHPAVQYHIVNSLGWPALRPLQERSIAPVLDGHHALLIAPTAGGKTEAAMLPVLSRMLSEEWRGLSVLYICPIKALLNNLEARLSRLARLLGRTVQLWHGDIGQGEKNRAQREPPDILLTTPESLEGILIGGRRDHLRLLGGVRCVVIDELHAFAGDDRGWHLLALLERIHALRGHEPQRIGLSATVGEPHALLNWLAAHCAGERSLVRVQVPPTEVDLCVDYAGSLRNAAILISRLHRGEKRLVFCDSRSRVEELSIALRALGVDVFVSHAALSVDTRRQAEQAFAERQNCVIVATSTLELGLDVGDLDRVIQIDAPGSVASFLQRLGRTGRRADSRRNLLFIATRDAGLLESLAIAQLFESGFVEPVVGPPMPCHLVVQQLFAMLFQHSLELEERVFTTTLRRIPGFAGLIDAHWDELREHLLARGFLIRNGLLLALGPKAERAFLGRGLADLCVSFDSPQLFTAFHGNKLLGHVDPLSLSWRRDGPTVLALGGRSWRVVSTDWTRDRVYVEAADEKGTSRWLGESRGVSRVIAEQVRRILAAPPADSTLLTKRSSSRIAELCAAQEDTLSLTPLRLQEGGFEWWTYAGLAANILLAARIAAAGGSCGAVGSYSFRFKISDAAVTAHGGWDAIRKLTPRLEPLDRQRIKFAELLPHDLLAEMSLRRINAKSRPRGGLS